MATRFVVRYGSMRHLGEFGARDADRRDDLRRGSKVIVRSHRGTEFGEILCEATERTRELLGRSDSTGRILRIASHDDDRIRETAWKRGDEFFRGCRDLIAQSGLPMQLVDVELLFGGEKLVFYYTSESRVDFRELVRLLAKEFKTRIEMRQIGIRDESKLLADYGDCGKPVCCNTHLDKMPRVSMKMAKLQKASLDPNKISGRCGRLKCCLRYEYDTYVEHEKSLPKQGKWVETEDGVGRVVAQEILAQKVLIAYEDGRRVLVSGEAIKGIVAAPTRDTTEKKNSPSERRPRPNKKSSDREDKPVDSGGGGSRRRSGKRSEQPKSSSNAPNNLVSNDRDKKTDDSSEDGKKKPRRRRSRSRNRRKTGGDRPDSNGSKPDGPVDS